MSIVMKILFLSLGLLISSLPLSVIAAPPIPSTETGLKADKAPVMLAYRWEGHRDIRGWWMSEKLDGVRGYWTGSRFISRSGKSLHAPKWFTQGFPPFALDGEFWTGRGRFSEIAGIVSRKTPHPGWKKVRYIIFDTPDVKGGFEKRIDISRRWFQQHPNPYAEVLKQEICKNEAHLRINLRKIESFGGEGLMLRRPDSPYTVGRSRDLLKVKSYHDAEAVVVEYIPGSGKNKGRLGSLLVELPNGVRFKIGTGFSDREREDPPPIGSIITFKYHGFHKSEIPRFASFLRIHEVL